VQRRLWVSSTHIDRQCPTMPEQRSDTIVHDGVEVPTSHARAWAVAAVVGGITAIWFILPGVFGMVAGSVAHLKGDRWGMPAAILSAITTIVGMALLFASRLT
jgi:hypothetical protein